MRNLHFQLTARAALSTSCIDLLGIVCRHKVWRSAAVAQPCKIQIVLVLRLRLSCNNTCSLTTTSSPPKGVRCGGWAQRHCEMQKSICEYCDANHDSALEVRTSVCYVIVIMVGMQPKLKH